MHSFRSNRNSNNKLCKCDSNSVSNFRSTNRNSGGKSCKCDSNSASKNRGVKIQRDSSIPCRDPDSQTCRYEARVLTNNKLECKCDSTRLTKKKKIDCKCEEGCLKKRSQKFYRQPEIPKSWAPDRKFVKPTIRMQSATEYKDNYIPKKLVKTHPIPGKDSMVLSKTPMTTISTYKASYTLPGTMHWETVETCGDPSQFNCYCEENEHEFNEKEMETHVHHEKIHQKLHKEEKGFEDPECHETCCGCGSKQ